MARSTPAQADEVQASESAWPGHVSYAIGYKRLGLGDSGPAPSRRFEFAGVDVDIGKANWPVSVDGQLLAAAGGGFISAEANLGLRKIWHAGFRGKYSYAQGEFTDQDLFTSNKTTTRINPDGAHALVVVGYNW